MTVEEFDNMKFVAGMKAIYKGKEFDIISVDFQERILALDMWGDDEYYWVRCENCQLVKQ